MPKCEFRVRNSEFQGQPNMAEYFNEQKSQNNVKLKKNANYSITFNNLTSRDDSLIPFTDGTRDQAVETINNANLDESNYNGI